MMTKSIDPKHLNVGDMIPSMEVEVTHKIYRKYNRLIGEINPIHFNKNYAQKLGFDTIVVAGNFLFTYIPSWIINWVGNYEHIKKITVKFDNPVYIDETIVHSGQIFDKLEEENAIEIICDYEVHKKDTKIRTSYGKISLEYIK